MRRRRARRTRKKAIILVQVIRSLLALVLLARLPRQVVSCVYNKDTQPLELDAAGVMLNKPLEKYAEEAADSCVRGKGFLLDVAFATMSQGSETVTPPS